MVYNKVSRRESAKVSARKVQTEVQTHRLKIHIKSLCRLSQTITSLIYKTSVHAGFRVKTTENCNRLEQTWA